jgi:segregation and condensation protein A
MLIEIVQEVPLAPIYVKAKASHEEPAELPADDAQAGESALAEPSGD